MAYFLKKSNYKKGTYLQIYESFYAPERKGGAHRSYKVIGYVHELQAKGIDDLLTKTSHTQNWIRTLKIQYFS